MLVLVLVVLVLLVWVQCSDQVPPAGRCEGAPSPSPVVATKVGGPQDAKSVGRRGTVPRRGRGDGNLNQCGQVGGRRAAGWPCAGGDVVGKECLLPLMTSLTGWPGMRLSLESLGGRFRGDELEAKKKARGEPGRGANGDGMNGRP